MPSPVHRLRPLISAERIRARIAELAAAIRDHYDGGEFQLLGVLRGARRFTEDLHRALIGVGAPEWIELASYGAGDVSSGRIELKRDVSDGVRDRHVLVVEDICDSGRTLAWLTEHLDSMGARSVKCCSLLDKPSRRVVPVSPSFIGFTVPDLFVVGYGMDHDGRYRDLPDIAVCEGA